MSVHELAEAIRSFPGVTRKNHICSIAGSFPTGSYPHVFAAAGEDAAVIDTGDKYTLLAADGIVESLMNTDPYLAGYFSVLVNVNDIAAMGGRPIGMVDVISVNADGKQADIIRGMQDGVKKFNVPIVGGHTHPDCGYNAIDISIAGVVSKDAVLLSSTAEAGDDIVFVMDLDGWYPECLPYAFVTTVSKPDDVVRGQMEAAAEIGERHLAHACKDMSNPGHIGTLGMMLESSGKGACVDVRKIPVPSGVDEIRWALSYQGCGFVFSCLPEKSAEIISVFRKAGCDGAVVGKVDDSGILRITDGKETATVFDFSEDIITGCHPGKKA